MTNEEVTKAAWDKVGKDGEEYQCLGFEQGAITGYQLAIDEMQRVILNNPKDK